MRIGIDAMGGDNAPIMEIRGALGARQFLQEEDRIVLVGQEPVIKEHLNGTADWQDWIEIYHTDQIIRMDDKPVEALRSKPNSSIARMAEMHRDGELDACISAGNTGACVAAAHMRLRRLEGVHRPGIAIIIPTLKGPVALCDVGANVACRPQHLYQYGVMSSVYINAVAGVKNPRVGVLSVGEEEGKGNELVRAARDLMKADPNVNFIGNVEGRDLFGGTCDVIVCDGFVGNVMLKLIEGMVDGVLKAIMMQLAGALGAELSGKVKTTAGQLVAKYDFNEYGGAPLLGVDGISIICHGASDNRGIMNAVRAASTFWRSDVNERITQMLSGQVEG